MQVLRDAKVERDRLAHRFFREHDEDFLGKSGRTKMIIECEEAIVRFSTADAKLETFIRPQRERYGITSEWIETQVKAATSKAEANS
jgi:hypothetical protein